MRPARFSIVLVTSAAGFGLAACTAKESPATKESAAVATPTLDSAKGGGMAGMPGMIDNAVMDSMQAHMRSMSGMGPDQMAAMLPLHRQMTANMVSQMSTDMRNMNMSADAAWTALADSVRQDLIRLPEMTKPELRQAMPGHQARVTRLMQMHKDMMGTSAKRE